jgi:hypothetical protein
MVKTVIKFYLEAETELIGFLVNKQIYYIIVFDIDLLNEYCTTNTCFDNILIKMIRCLL